MIDLQLLLGGKDRGKKLGFPMVWIGVTINPPAFAIVYRHLRVSIMSVGIKRIISPTLIILSPNVHKP